LVLWIAVIVRRLREIGRITNRTVAIEYRWAEERDECHAVIAAELMRLKLDSAPKKALLTTSRSLH
jgi:hypothetical protein